MRLRKSFILFELLIGIALISSVILPFLHYPFRDVKAQLDTMILMELQQEAQRELARWEEAFYRKDDELMKRAFGEKSDRSQMEKNNKAIVVELSSKIKRKFEKKVYCYHSGRKKMSDGSVVSLVNFKVEYYRLPKEKDAKPLFRAKRQVVAQKKI